MSIRTCTAIILALVVSALASAQAYTVRVTHNTNLRASHSLQADIMDSARAGSAVQVVGSFNRWLKIDREGRTLWMADWAPMTRVESAPPQSSANVDNCCFVDRQCSADQDWVDGYWAYQNGQCPAAPPQQTTSPASDQPEVNNCCFLDWTCHSEDDWKRGYQAWQANSCAAGPEIFSGVKIEGSASFTAYVIRGFNLLKRHAPHWYQYAVSGLSAVIEVNPPHGASGVNVQTAVAYFNHNPHVVFVPTDDMTMAEFLLHEACHVQRFRAGLEAGGYPGEKACIEAEVTLWQEVAPGSEHHNRKLRYLAVIHLRECQHWLPPVPGGCPQK